jgi:curved DNA-binding protein CbpA
MEDKTHYEILGVPPDASQHATRNAFMKLAEKYQSDRAKFSAAGGYLDRLKDAYDAVSDYDSRCRYNAERGLPEPPEPEDSTEVSWFEGITSVIPSNWHVFAFMAVGAIMYAAYRFKYWWVGGGYEGGLPSP